MPRLIQPDTWYFLNNQNNSQEVSGWTRLTLLLKISKRNFLNHLGHFWALLLNRHRFPVMTYLWFLIHVFHYNFEDFFNVFPFNVQVFGLLDKKVLIHNLQNSDNTTTLKIYWTFSFLVHDIIEWILPETTTYNVFKILLYF